MKIMVLRFAGFLVLALLSSACTYRTATPIHAAAVDDSDHEQYDQPFGQSPSRPAPPESPAETEAAAAAPAHHEATPARGNALGFSADASHSPDTLTTEVSATEYEEVEATPGTACYDAAMKAGITSGTCTLVFERKYVLVGEKAR